MRYNFHTHSHYDDGKESMEDYIHSAMDKGLVALGFSGHSPLFFENKWCIKPEVYPDYVAEVKRLKQQYNGIIEIYLGLEIDYIPGHSEDFSSFINSTPLDYSIGSVHLVRPDKNKPQMWFIDGPAEGYFKGLQEVFDGDIKKAVTAFYNQSIEMVMTQPMDIIGHADKVKMHNAGKLFSQDEPWYQGLVDSLLKAIKEKEVIVELNTRGIYSGKSNEFFPSNVFLEKCLHLDIPVMVSVDAHHPDQLDTLFDEAVAHLKDIGFKKMTTPFFVMEIW
jgi:histidinol-phosphatase (PHP family)